MRQLSLRQAWNCETAREDRCRCRCGGLLHGARRAQRSNELHQLPAGDPHHVPERKKVNLGPLRRVIGYRTYRDKFAPSYGRTAELKLECGHVLYQKSSKGRPRRVHCPSCKKAA
jgi:hypothetical protein